MCFQVSTGYNAAPRKTFDCCATDNDRLAGRESHPLEIADFYGIFV